LGTTLAVSSLLLIVFKRGRPTGVLFKERIGVERKGGESAFAVVQGSKHELLVVGFDEDVLADAGEALGEREGRWQGEGLVSGTR
jgi:hypothetical protein